MRFERFAYGPGGKDADDQGRALYCDDAATTDIDAAEVLVAAGFDPEDEEAGIYRLSEPWGGRPAGALVVSGLVVEGHHFAVEVR